MANPFNGHRTWWKEGIVYQIYPRSFKDSNGDGIGDIAGIISKLDYLQHLGIDMIWINPIYASPNDDNGYDISDYKAIMTEYGTMQDFDNLLKGLHERNIRLMLDFVLNHTSDEHPWFREACQSRDNPYYNYYLWWPAEKGQPPYRYSFFDKAGDAWAFNEPTNSYYLHYFSRKMPDLNWDNPEMRKKMYNILHWWFKKGVDGIRLDAVPYISKDATWPVITKEDIKEKYRNDWSYYYSQGPNLHQHLQELHEEVLSRYDVTTIAEAPGIKHQDALRFVKEESKELHMLYHFEVMQLGYVKGAFKRPDPNGFDLLKFKEVHTRWNQVFAQEGWGTVYLGNHDQPRMTTRWGNDGEQYRKVSAKLLITFLLTMRGTPIFYNGDELGMTNIKFTDIKDYRDVETRSMYEYIRSQQGDVEQFVRDQQFSGRDNSRTPFQWNATDNAGFTTGQPWLKVNNNYTYINAGAQYDDPDSILNYFRRLLKLRKEKLVLVYGEYQLHEAFHPHLYVYTRTLEQEKLLVILNFSCENVTYQLPGSIIIQSIVVNNAPLLQVAGNVYTLLPYQAVVAACK